LQQLLAGFLVTLLVSIAVARKVSRSSVGATRLELAGCAGLQKQSIWTKNALFKEVTATGVSDSGYRASQLPNEDSFRNRRCLAKIAIRK
jgi:hypothetical protein